MSGGIEKRLEQDKEQSFPELSRVVVVDREHPSAQVKGFVLYIEDPDDRCEFIVSLDNGQATGFTFTQLKLADSDSDAEGAEAGTAAGAAAEVVAASRPHRACRNKPLVPETGACDGLFDTGDGLQTMLNDMSPETLDEFLRSLNEWTEVRESGIARNENGLYAKKPIPRDTPVALLFKRRLRRLKKNKPGKGKVPWYMKMTPSQRASMEIECDCGDYLWAHPENEWPFFRGNFGNDDRDNPNAVFIMVIVHAKKPKEPRDSMLYVFVVAKRDLAEGEEIGISYGIGLEVDLSWNFRVIVLT